MLKNYLKIAYRNFIRNRAFSLINVFGLAVGLATCLLIMLYILDESSYDRQHKDGDRLFRVASVSNKGETWAAAAGTMAQAMQTELPEVEQTTRLMTFPYIEKMLVKYKTPTLSRQFFETNGYYVDSNFFQLFTYSFKYGNAAAALNLPNSIVLSDKMAHKFFDREDPVGRSVKVSTPFGEMDYTIRGVFNDQTSKSHIPANYFLSMRNNDMWKWVQQQTGWMTNNVFFTYVQLKPATNAKAFEKRLNVFLQRHAGADMKAAGFGKTLYLQPVKEIYLHSAIGNEIAANGNITYLYILGSIAAFILLIACINFMNLSTARSQKRAREVGVRKVLGAEKWGLVRQFLGESILMCFLSLVLALLLANLAMPLFNDLTHKDLRLFEQPVIVLWIAGLTLLTGLLAGIYPAFYLSAFRPVSVLKGKIINSFAATAIRKGLVVFQFTISISLVLAAIVIWQQLNLLENKDLGFNQQQQLVLPLKQTAHENEEGYRAMKNALMEIPGVKGISSASGYPGNPDLSDLLFFAEGKKVTDAVDVQLAGIETDYVKNMGLTLLQGREFSKGYAADSAGIILNETAVRQMGYTPENAVGRPANFDFPGGRGKMQIIGVVKDFNFESLHKKIRPFGFTNGLFAGKYAYTIVTLNTKNYSRLLQEIRKVWTRLNPETPLVYSFLDQDFQRNYERDRLTSRIVLYFTAIAILIACLGLFGLAAFSAEQRTREIGIRKVLGASVTNVATLLSGDFIRLVIIAAVIASPLAWFGMNQWLQGFEYRVSISWWMFAAAGLLAVLIALITVSSQAIRAALTNPIKNLRTE